MQYILNLVGIYQLPELLLLRLSMRMCNLYVVCREYYYSLISNQLTVIKCV